LRCQETPHSVTNSLPLSIKAQCDRTSVRVSIIIPNLNGLRHLPECLGSLEKQSFRDFEVILVDNGSSDGSIEYLRQQPSVRVVALDKNRGFAGGNNAGLAVARGEYIVTLNNDTRAESGFLAELVAVADRHPQAGMVAARICNSFEPDAVDSLGIAVCRDAMSRGAHRGSRFSALSLPAVAEILIPSACAALYRRAMLDEIGFFDDDFFAYCEDSDLGLRGRLAGWGALLARDAVVYHKYSMTSGAFSPLKLYLVERNHYFVAVKTLPLPLLLLVPFFTVIRYFTQAALVINGHGSGGEFLASGSRSACVFALLRGMRDALLAAPELLRKRKAVMRNRRIGSIEMMRLLKNYRMSFKELLDQ
jgi:GT2 family glycosyltransferase